MDACEEGVIKVLDGHTLEAKSIARAEVSDRPERGARGKRLYLYGFDPGYQDITEVVLSVGGVSTSLKLPPLKKGG